MFFYTRKILRVTAIIVVWLGLAAAVHAILAVAALMTVSCALMLLGVVVMPTDTTPAVAATAMVLCTIAVAGSAELVCGCWNSIGCYADWVREIIRERPKMRYVR